MKNEDALERELRDRLCGDRPAPGGTDSPELRSRWAELSALAAHLDALGADAAAQLHLPAAPDAEALARTKAFAAEVPTPSPRANQRRAWLWPLIATAAGAALLLWLFRGPDAPGHYPLGGGPGGLQPNGVVATIEDIRTFRFGLRPPTGGRCELRLFSTDGSPLPGFGEPIEIDGTYVWQPTRDQLDRLRATSFRWEVHAFDVAGNPRGSASALVSWR